MRDRSHPHYRMTFTAPRIGGYCTLHIRVGALNHAERHENGCSLGFYIIE